ncbi:hypothetical protein FDB34_12890 [Clostridium botulinum]|nr:hypothetical protein [Clostridium botulinum]
MHYYRYKEFLEYKSLVKKLLDGTIKPVELLKSDDLIQNIAAQKTAISFVNNSKTLIVPS